MFIWVLITSGLFQWEELENTFFLKKERRKLWVNNDIYNSGFKMQVFT